MKELSLQQLAAWCGGTVLPEDANPVITGTQHDSRDIRPGDLFIAFSGEHFDGHSFVSKAREAGAAAALVNHPVEDELPQLVWRIPSGPTATLPGNIGWPPGSR